MQSDFKKVTTHHWLLRPKENLFHAYKLVRAGEVPICETGKAIMNIKEMNIPSDRSPCCINCFDELYKVGVAVNSKAKG